MITTKQDRLNAVYEELIVRRIVRSKKEFAEELNYEYTGLIAAMSGNRPTTVQMLSAIGNKWRFFNREWLINGSGSSTTDKEVQSDGNRFIEVPEEHFMKVLVKDLDEANNLWKNYFSDGYKDKEIRVIEKQHDEGIYFILRVKGFSMDDGSKRSICEGDELLIKEYLGDVKAMPIRNKLFVICTSEGNVVTQVADIDHTTGDITCRSFNPLYQDYVIPAEKITQTFTVEKKMESKIIF